MPWLEDNGRVAVFRLSSNNSNGNTFDFQSRRSPVYALYVSTRASLGYKPLRGAAGERREHTFRTERDRAQAHAGRIEHRIAERRRHRRRGGLAGAERWRVEPLDQLDLDRGHLGEGQDRVRLP